jgi:hypothetical protein
LLSRVSAAAPRSRLQFAEEFIPPLRELLGTLLSLSPVGRVLFTTDWQFGPKRPRRFAELTHSEFWRAHDAGDLRLNSAYPLHGA